MQKEFSDVNDLVLDIYNTNELLQEHMVQDDVDGLKALCKLLLDKLECFDLYYYDE